MSKVDLNVADAALRLIEFARERGEAYDAINKQIIALDASGLQFQLSACDDSLWGAVMRVLDAMLGDIDADGQGLASYYQEGILSHGANTHRIFLADGRMFPLTNAAEVLAYLAARNELPE